MARAPAPPSRSRNSAASKRAKPKVITYRASPTFQKVHTSQSRIKCVIGPVGSGSSTGTLFDILLRAQRQTPDPDGIRRRRVLVARATYPELETTVKKTMQTWLPKATGFQFTGRAPIYGRLTQPLGDGTIMDLEFIMMSIEGEVEVEEKLRSFEISDIWFNEAKELPFAALKYGQQRLGRYPEVIADENGDVIFNGCDNPTINMDTNMCDTGHWIYTFFEETHKTNPNIQLFLQPGALIMDDEGNLKENPRAENIKFLPSGYEYYWNIVETAPDTVKTDVLNEWGSVHHGKAVYSKEYYRDDEHYQPHYIDPNPNYPLLIGIDWGTRYSAYVFCQYLDAQLVVYDELCLEDMALEVQMEDHVIPLLQQKYLNYRVQGFADPAGRIRDAYKGVRLVDYMRNTYGIETAIPSTNKPSVRIDAVKYYLYRRGGFVMSSQVKDLRKGFLGGYHYEVKRGAVDANTGQSRLNEKPAKGPLSHIHDALQYVALGLRESMVRSSMDVQPTAVERITTV